MMSSIFPRSAWHLDAIGAGDSTGDGAGCGVALFDSGLDVKEGAARQQLKKGNDGKSHYGAVYGRDFTGGFRIFDDYGHGTKMAAIIAARAGDGEGMTSADCLGVAPKTALYNLKVTNQDGDVSGDAVLRAARKIVDAAAKRPFRHAPVKVAVLPFDLQVWQRHKGVLRRALKTLVSHDVLVILSSGDEPAGIDLSRLPRAKVPWRKFFDQVLVVAGSGPEPKPRRLTPTSNYGNNSVHLAAPGEQIPTLSPLTRSLAFGSSAAAAVTAGAAARVYSARPRMSASEIRKALLDAALPDSHLAVAAGHLRLPADKPPPEV